MHPRPIRTLLVALAIALTALAQAQTDLIALAENGTPEQVRAALAAGADVHARNSAGASPLMAAMFHDTHTAEITELLLAAGADPNVRSGPRSVTVLGVAATIRPHTVPLLLEAGARVDAAATDGETPLISAVYSAGSVEATVALLAAGADPNLSNTDGHTALHFAAINAGVDPVDVSGAILEALLAAGADPNATDNSGFTVLAFAAHYASDASLVQLLLTAGADLHARSGDTSLTALHMAIVFNPNPEVALALLTAGADPNGQSGDGVRPLTLAAEVDATGNLIRALIGAGATIHTGTPEEPVPTVAHAVTRGTPDAVRALVDAGARIDQLLPDGSTLLIGAAILSEHPEMLDFLLAAGIDPLHVNDDGLRAIDYARDNRALYGTPAYWRLNDLSY